MAGAFASGFRMGGEMYDAAERSRIITEREKREAERWGLERDALQDAAAQRARERGIQSQVDAYTRQLVSPNAANYEFNPTPATGLRVPAQGDGLGFTAPTQGIQASAPTQGYALAADAPAAGLRPGNAAAAPAGGYTNNAAPERGAAENILGRIALLKGDTTGFRQSQQNKRGFEEEDLVRSALKEYTGAPEQIDATVGYINETSSSVTLSDPDKRKFVWASVVKPNGRAEFLKLNRADQATLYAAGRLMEMNPAKALEMIGKINQNLAAAIAADNGLKLNVGTKNNDAAYKTGELDNKEVKLGLDRMALGAQADYYRKSAANLDKPQFITLEDEKRNPVIVDQRKLPIVNGVLTLPNGLRIPRDRTAEVTLASNLYKEWMKENPDATATQKQQALDEIRDAVGTFSGTGGGGPLIPGLNIEATASRIGGNTAPAASPKSGGLKPTVPERPSTEPADRNEWLMMQRALQLGYESVGRGNALFGRGELLFRGPDGKTLWASQLPK